MTEAVPDYAREVIKKSVKPNTLEKYGSQRDTFKAWQKSQKIASEREAYLAYCQEKERQGKPSGSMATLFYAIKKHFVLTNSAESKWLNESWVGPFVKGLKYEAGTSDKRVRLGLTLEMQQALGARARKEGFHELAAGYNFMFRTLLRHDHMSRILSDQMAFYDDTPLGTPYVKVWCTGFKGDSDFGEGQWVKCAGMNEELREQERRSTASKSGRLFPKWEENLAVSFLQNTAHHLGWPKGFKYDAHCLRVGGAGEQEMKGASVHDLRMGGRWASGVVHDYRATMAPGQGLIKLDARSAPKIRRGKRSRTTERVAVKKKAELEDKQKGRKPTGSETLEGVKVKKVRGRNGRVLTMLM